MEEGGSGGGEGTPYEMSRTARERGRERERHSGDDIEEDQRGRSRRVREEGGRKSKSWLLRVRSLAGGRHLHSTT